MRWNAAEIGTNLPSFGGGIARVLQPLDNVVGNDRAVELLLDPACGAAGAQRDDADEQRDAIGQSVLGKPRDVAAHDLDVHAKLRLSELRAGGNLALQALRHPVCGRIDRHVGSANEEVGLAGDLAAREQFAAVADRDRGFDQRAGIEIEHRFGIRLIARARVVAAQHQQVADAERRRAEQVALQGEPVAVAASELQHRLDAGLMQDRGRRHGAEMGARARPIRDVHGVGEAFQRQRLGEQLVAIARDGRRDLGGDDEAAGGDRFFQFAAIGFYRHLGFHAWNWATP